MGVFFDSLVNKNSKPATLYIGIVKYYLIAGEASGDLHGANLMKALKKEDPPLSDGISTRENATDTYELKKFV